MEIKGSLEVIFICKVHRFHGFRIRKTSDRVSYMFTIIGDKNFSEVVEFRLKTTLFTKTLVKDEMIIG